MTITHGVTLTSSPTTLTGAYSYVYGPATGVYSVTNLGAVTDTPGNNFPGAIYLKLGGSVTNGSASDTSASVTGYGTNAGVAIVYAPGTITNWGTIDGGTLQRGVRLYDGGTLVNGSPTDTLAVIRGHGIYSAVGIGGSTGTIPSGGGGSGGSDGIIVTTGSLADPPASTVINYGTIGNPDAKNGIAFATGAGLATVINGSTADTVALITSGSASHTSGVGVYIGSPAGGTIENFATIGSADGRAGINLGTLAGTVAITNESSGLITGGTSDGSAIYTQNPSSRVHIVNYGTMQAAAASAINLHDGGTVTNGSGVDTSAVIKSTFPHSAVYDEYGVATVVNYGTIGDSSGKTGISFSTHDATGTVVNGSPTATTALIISGDNTIGGTGVYFGNYGGGVIQNFATIGGPGGRSGVYLGPMAGAVTITNGSPEDGTALITGGTADGNAIAANDTNGLIDVVNFATIAGTGAAGIGLDHGGTVTNGSVLDTSALIRGNGTHSAIYTKAGVTTVVNYGTIGSASGANAVAFSTAAGFGTIVNGSTADETALITGGATGGNAINSGGPTDRLEIANFGTIAAPAAAAIFLSDGGSVTNGSAGDTSALIQAPGTHSAVYAQGGVTETVVNFGTIGGTAAGVAVDFGAAAGNAVVVNGSTADTTALIVSGTSSAAGVSMNNHNSVLAVANFGTITSVTETGIYLAGGGTVTNGSAGDTVAAIIGNADHSAISAKKFVTVSNFGTISNPGTLHPVYGTAGASITNGSPTDTTALMSAVGSGVKIKGGALTLTNFATIANTGGAGSALYTVGGTITNGSPTDTTATIIVDGSSGDGIGVYGSQPGPITNFGTISGGASGHAILFFNPGALVVDEPGAVFNGVVDASAGGSTMLQLASGASAGTLNGIGTNFTGFNNITVDAGASWQLAGSNSLAGGQTLTVAGTLTATSNLAGVGQVELSGGIAALGNSLSSFIGIGMVTPTVNTLILSGSSGGTVANTISNLGLGDRIEVAGVVFNGGSLNGGTGMQLTEDGSPVFTLADIGFAGGVPQYSFNTDITNGNSFVQFACFAAGTRILTTAGEVPVEAMREGMLVPSLTHARPLRVRWVGHRQVNCAAHPRPHEVWPVCIAAHAFGPDAPHRDLWLSPDHAVFVGGDAEGGAPDALIPVRYLVNGTTIARREVAEVAYFHVELDRHAVLLAEGLATESYLDTGNRCAFANGGGAVPVHPDFALRIWDTAACAPLVVAGPLLAQARKALVARAQALGFALTAEPELVVIAGGHLIAPAPVGEGWLQAELPPGATAARLVSRTMVPAETGGATDTRRLGVAVAALLLDGAPVALDDARLGDGWHAPEPDLRWTGGDARIAVAGHRVLRLRIVQCGHYWAPARVAMAAITP